MVVLVILKMENIRSKMKGLECSKHNKFFRLSDSCPATSQKISQRLGGGGGKQNLFFCSKLLNALY